MNTYDEINEEVYQVFCLLKTLNVLNYRDLNDDELYNMKNTLINKKQDFANFPNDIQRMMKTSRNFAMLQLPSFVLHLFFAFLTGSLFMWIYCLTPVLLCVYNILDIKNKQRLLKRYNSVTEIIDNQIKQIQDIMEERYLIEKQKQLANLPKHILNNRARYEFEDDDELILKPEKELEM